MRRNNVARDRLLNLPPERRLIDLRGLEPARVAAVRT